MKKEELPEGFHVRESQDGLIRRGGLLLMKCPTSLVEQRAAMIHKRTMEQIYGANELQGISSQGRGLPVHEADKSRTLEGKDAMSFLSEASES